jgi:hypothetical protein
VALVAPKAVTLVWDWLASLAPGWLKVSIRSPNASLSSPKLIRSSLNTYVPNKGLHQSGSYGILLISNPAIIFEKGRTRWFSMTEAGVV